MHTHWTMANVAEAFESYSFAEAWSNWVLQAVILWLCGASILRNRRTQGRSLVTGFTGCMLALVFINLAASAGHGIEHLEQFELLASQIRYTNFALIGFASLFLEYWVLERIAVLARETSVESFRRFPVRLFKVAVVVSFVVFQLVNWLSRSEPDFLYAIVDYGASMVMMAGLSVYILRKGPGDLDSRFERRVLGGVAVVLTASVSQQLPVVRELMPYDGVFHYNDLYHLICVVAFVVFDRADRCLASA